MWLFVEAAKRGFESYGVELNLWLVLYSKIQALRCGLKAKFIRTDLWKHDLRRYDNIIIFGVEQMMGELEKKFLRECERSTNIVACRFPLPNVKPQKTIGSGIDTVWLYKINS